MPIVRMMPHGRPKEKPHPLLDHLVKTGWGKSDKELAALFKLSPATISKVRNGTKATPEFILAVYDATDLSIEQIRELL